MQSRTKRLEVVPQFTNKCFRTTREAKAWLRAIPSYEKATFKIAMNRQNYVRYAPSGAQLVCVRVYFEAAQRFQMCWFAVSV